MVLTGRYRGDIGEILGRYWGDLGQLAQQAEGRDAHDDGEGDPELAPV